MSRIQVVDLGDAVADEVSVPFEQISLEMLYRGLYHFSVAYNKGKATHPVADFTAANQDLRVVKRYAFGVCAAINSTPAPLPPTAKSPPELQLALGL